MKITFPLVTCFSVLCLTLAGCGGSDSDDNRSSSSAPGSSSSSSAVASSEPASSSSSESSIAVSSEASSEASSSEAASSESSSAESSSSESSSESSAAAWDLVWFDEFDGETIDTTKWEHEVNCWGGGNNEAQCYTASLDNSYVSDGLLNITSIYEGEGEVCGPALNQEDPGYPGATVCKDYSSARLRTRGKADWTYGRMEIRAKMPQGKGIWPALWMLPTDTTTYGGWPHSGEIDIFEAFQPGVAGPQPTGAPNEMHGTLHYGFSWPWNQYSGASYEPPTNIWDDFYTYAVEWEEGEIRWYVDDVLFAVNRGNWFIYYWGGQEVGYQIGTEAQPFDKPFHMIMNVALGNGTYIDLPDFTDSRTMQVDYVRVYQCSVDPLTGKGCTTPTADEGVTPTDIVGHVPPPDVLDEVWLFRGSQGGIQTLTFDVNDTEVTNTLQHAVWNDSGALVSNPVATPINDGSGGAVVWDLQFNNAGPAVAWLASADMSGVEGVQDGFNFGSDPLHNRARQLGEYKFDIWVETAEPNTKLSVKLGSGFPDISIEEIALTPDMVGKWTPVSVRFYNLRQAPGSWSAVDWSSIMRPFETEILGGAAHIQLDNIRIACLEDCDIKPKEPPVALTETFDVFVDAIDPNWDFGIGVYETAGGHVTNAVVDADEVERGKVLEVSFNSTANGLIFIQATGTKDISAFAEDGYLSFDIKVADYGVNTSGLVVKADCVNPCSSGDIPVGVVGDGAWETVTVPISQMVTGGLDLTKVNTPFVLLPTWDSQQGVNLQLDNIRWINP